jgi:hypothetical protein
MTGRLSSEVTAWCGMCGQWEYTNCSRKGPAARVARARGWVKTKEHGWICPACVLPKGKA